MPFPAKTFRKPRIFETSSVEIPTVEIPKFLCKGELETQVKYLPSNISSFFRAAFDENMDNVNQVLQQLNSRQQERNYYSSNVPKSPTKSLKHRRDSNPGNELNYNEWFSDPLSSLHLISCQSRSSNRVIFCDFCIN